MSRIHDEDDRHASTSAKADRSRAEPLGSSLAPMLLDLDDDIPTRDEVANRFFAQSPEGVRLEIPAPVDEGAMERSRFESLAARRRQRYLMRYVAGAVAASSAICLMALVRTTAARGAVESEPMVPHAAAMSFSPPETASPPVAAPAAEPPVAPVPEPVVAAVRAAVASPAPSPSPGTSPGTSPAGAEVAPPALSARDEKRLALGALERGNWGAAIAAGERSVALDATDGDAWLVLGGAYQQRGAEGKAQRCYASCARLARSGSARAECVALAR